MVEQARRESLMQTMQQQKISTVVTPDCDLQQDVY